MKITDVKISWDASSETAYLSFDNNPEGIILNHKPSYVSTQEAVCGAPIRAVHFCEFASNHL